MKLKIVLIFLNLIFVSCRTQIAQNPLDHQNQGFGPGGAGTGRDTNPDSKIPLPTPEEQAKALRDASKKFSESEECNSPKISSETKVLCEIARDLAANEKAVKDAVNADPRDVETIREDLEASKGNSPAGTDTITVYETNAATATSVVSETSTGSDTNTESEISTKDSTTEGLGIALLVVGALATIQGISEIHNFAVFLQTGRIGTIYIQEAEHFNGASFGKKIQLYFHSQLTLKDVNLPYGMKPNTTDRKSLEGIFTQDKPSLHKMRIARLAGLAAGIGTAVGGGILIMNANDPNSGLGLASVPSDLAEYAAQLQHIAEQIRLSNRVRSLR